jgi:hypothetical protein
MVFLVGLMPGRLSMEEHGLTDVDLERIERRCNAATRDPWESFIEGRDHSGGSNFIRTGGLDPDSPDIELLGATEDDQDFIAHARQGIPRLLQEVRRLKRLLSQ